MRKNQKKMLVNDNFVTYNSDFLATRYINKHLEPVQFQLEVHFQFGPSDDKTDEASIAYNKLEFFVQHVLHKSIFISKEDKFWLDKNTREHVTTNYVLFPEAPYDDWITRILFYKLQAISFPGLMIIDVSAWSSSTKLNFHFAGEEQCTLPGMQDWIGELAFHDQPWWHRDDCDTIDIIPKDKKELDNPPESSVNFDIINEIMSGESDLGEVVELAKFRPQIVE